MKANQLSFQISYKSLLIIWYFSYVLIYPMFSMVTSTKISQWLFNIVLLFLLVFVISKDRRALKRDAIFVWLASLVALGITCLIHPEYSDVLFGDTFNFVKSVFSLSGPLMGYLVIRTENNSKKLEWDLKISAIIVWIAYTIKTFNGVKDVRYSSWTGDTSILTYNQAYGFYFLFCAIVFLYFYLKEKKKIYIVPFLICVIQILMYASRTAVLSLVCYVILYLFFEDTGKGSNQKKVLYSVALIFVTLILNSNTFMTWVISTIKNLGLSSKIIDAFVSGNNAIDGGRIYLYTEGWNAIVNNPLGLGVFCDRYLFGHYTHNIIIEILLDFGWFIGGALLVGLIVLIAKMLLSKRCVWKSFFLIFLSLTIVRLSLSYSFWQDANFWIMIAIAVTYSKTGKYEVCQEK